MVPINQLSIHNGLLDGTGDNKIPCENGKREG